MATSCIYFVLVLTILSLRNTSAAFQNNYTRNHNFNNNNINNTNTSNNYNNNNNNNSTIESATQQHSAGILRYSESSASELSSTNYSKYQAEKERYRIHPDIDSETDSEASNTHKNNKNNNSNNKEKENTNSAKQTDTERQQHHHHLGDTDIFGAYSLPDDPIYTNEFAVHIPAGKYVADGIADKYGFINRGQVIVIRKCQWNNHNNKKTKRNIS